GLLILGWRVSMVIAGAVCVLLAAVLVPAVAPLDTRLDRRGTVREPLPAADSAPAAVRSVRPNVRGAGALWAVLRDAELRRLSLMSLAFACTQLVFITFLVSLLNLQLGHSLVWAAGTLALAQIASTVSRIAFGYIADRWIDPARLLGILGLAMGAACIALSLLGHATGIGWTVAAAIFCAATAMGWNGVFFAQLTRTAIQRGDLATIAGASQFFTFAGSMSGPVVFAEIIRVGGSYSLGFLLLAALPAAAGGWMLWGHLRDVGPAGRPR
ncbi:MAG: MFS transporter, partial [Caldimonas sp.]